MDVLEQEWIVTVKGRRGKTRADNDTRRLPLISRSPTFRIAVMQMVIRAAAKA